MPRSLLRARCLRLALVPAAAATMALVSSPALAATSAEDVVTGFHFRVDGGPAESRIAIENLYPSDERVVQILLDGMQTQAVDAIALDVEGLEDHEQGCLRPEDRSGDDCDSLDGELSKFLDVTVQAGIEVADGDSRACVADSAAPVVGPHTLSDLAAGDSLVTKRAGDGPGAMCLVARLQHVLADGDNVTQTDTTSFGFRLTFGGTPVLVTADQPIPVRTPDDGAEDEDPIVDPDEGTPTPAPTPPGTDPGEEGSDADADTGSDGSDGPADGPTSDEQVAGDEVLAEGWSRLPRTGTSLLTLAALAALLIGAGTVTTRFGARSQTRDREEGQR